MPTYSEEYLMLVRYILDSESFVKLEEFAHHGTNRLIHSMRVSYYSYRISKRLKLDHRSAAIAGLLHDFYDEEDPKQFIKFLRFQNSHPKLALTNAKRQFNVTEKVSNIIVTHMFPFTKPSKYIEGWIISFVDKGVAIYEYLTNLKIGR